MTTSSRAVLRTERSGCSTKVGYLVAIGLQGFFLWVAHQLLEWGWPSFLTADFDQVLPWVTASLVASIVVNVCFLVKDDGWFRALGDAVTAGFGLASAIVTWQVFPFDFSAWSTDWTWLVRLVVAVGIVGSAIALLVNASRFVSRITGRS